MACPNGNLPYSDHPPAGSVAAGSLIALASKWLSHFDALALAREPNCSIYWECASELLVMVEYSRA